MLLIREAQMEALGRALVHDFHRELLHDVQNGYPGWRKDLDRAAQFEVVDALVERAQYFGAFGRKQIRRLVLALVPYEPDFKANATAWAILTDASLLGSAKAERLEALTAEIHS